MIASLRPEEAIFHVDWLINSGIFSLTNVESLMFVPDSDCDPGTLAWNQLKGSWEPRIANWDGEPINQPGRAGSHSVESDHLKSTLTERLSSASAKSTGGRPFTNTIIRYHLIDLRTRM